MDHVEHHGHDEAGCAGSTDGSGSGWHHDHAFSMAGDDHDRFTHPIDHDDEQTHPAGCPCCCGDAGEAHDGSSHVGSPGSGVAHDGAASGGSDHPWSHTLGALPGSDHDTTSAAASAAPPVTPAPAATASSLVPSAPLPSGAGPAASSDTVTITDDNPVFAQLLAENPGATQETALDSLSKLHGPAATEVATMMDDLAATNAAIALTNTSPDGVVVVPRETPLL